MPMLKSTFFFYFKPLVVNFGKGFKQGISPGKPRGVLIENIDFHRLWPQVTNPTSNHEV